MSVIELNTKELNDLKSLTEHSDTRIVPDELVKLDISDEVHYRFYTKQLELAGITPANRPQLYRIIEKVRKEPRKWTASPPIASKDLLDYSLADLIVIDSLYVYGPNDSKARGSAFASLIANSFLYARLDLLLYAGNGLLIGKDDEEIYPPTTELEVKVNGDIPPGEELKAMLTFTYVDRLGKVYIGFINASTVAGVDTITNLDPKPKSGQSEIKLCLGRSGADCTYEPPGGTASNVTMPIKGSITYTSDINPKPSSSRSCSITIANPDPGAGGGAKIESTSDFFNHPNTKIEGNKISWDLTAKFESAGGVLKANSAAIYTFVLTVVLQGNNAVRASITNAPDADDGPGTLKIAPMKVFFSCLAEGSQVMLYDGMTIPIERVQPGDKVITNLEGVVQGVEGILKGTEVVPMVRLKTDYGHDLLLTDGHPVVTPTGVVLAKMLKVRGQVVTDRGNATITQASEEWYSGYVYNLNVGPRQEINYSDDSTFFANGILVGDNQMQFKYNRQFANMPSSVLEKLPKEWHQDYLNYLKETGQEHLLSGS